jgi:glycine/D-amino acid oxidase-like deaminating enzyme
LRALQAATIRAGAAYRADHHVSRITPRAEGFVLDTAAGTLAAAKVVLAAGLGNSALTPMVGLASPVRPNQGQIIVLERVPRFLALPLQTIRQTDEGTVLIGDSQQDRGFDDSCGIDVLAAMAARAARVFPALGGARRRAGRDCVMTLTDFPVTVGLASGRIPSRAATAA